MNNILLTASVWAIPVLLAVTLHEAAHGWVAWRLGDDTAKRMGRVSFNPFRHIDPVGTVLVPLLFLFASGGRMMFGFAKPVPVNFRALGRPRRDMVLVALAGPGANFALAAVSTALLHGVALFQGDLRTWIAYNLLNSVWINVLLGIFNMLPVPPLDGGRIAVGVLPESLGRPLARLERVGILIIVVAVFVLPWIGEKIGVDLNLFQLLVVGPAEIVRNGLFHLFSVS